MEFDLWISIDAQISTYPDISGNDVEKLDDLEDSWLEMIESNVLLFRHFPPSKTKFFFVSRFPSLPSDANWSHVRLCKTV
jgi:hypothetical protein